MLRAAQPRVEAPHSLVGDNLLMIEPQNLQTGHTGCTRESNVRLTLFENATEIYLDTLERLALRLVNGQRPRENERNLISECLRPMDSE